ncbi:MAG: transposase [Deltaproteobacteria bacterium]|nr:transposase [Deltaproteobacteria bacterium]
MSQMIKFRESKAGRWQRIIAEQIQSGQSASSYCRDRGIPDSSLGYWKRKLRRPVSQKEIFSQSKKKFMALSVSADRFAERPRIVLPNGVVIEIGSSLKSEAVMAFIQRLCGVHGLLKDGVYEGA